MKNTTNAAAVSVGSSVRIIRGGNLPVAGMTGTVVEERAIPGGGRDYSVRLDGDLPIVAWIAPTVRVARVVKWFDAGDLAAI